jgi:radical SAM protein with 4Fe4S-binding SPASM domain
MYVEGTQQVYVDWDGTVVPCCVHPKAGELGNLRHQLLSEIFSGAQRAEFVETMRTARETLPICRICEYGPSDDPGPSAGNDAPDFAIAPSGGDAH